MPLPLVRDLPCTFTRPDSSLCMPQQKLQHQGIDRGSSATAAALDVLQDEEAEQARVSAASKRSPSAHAVAQDRASHARASLKGALGDLMVKGSKLPAQFAERDVRTLKGALADLDLYERSIDAKAQGLQGLVHHQDVKASHVQHVMSHLKMKPWMVKLFSGAAESQSVDDKAARSERRLVSKFLSAAERVQSRTDKGGGEQKRAHAPAPAQKQSAHRAGQADQEVQAGSGAGKKRRGDVDAQIRTDLQAVMRAHTPESKKQAAEGQLCVNVCMCVICASIYKYMQIYTRARTHTHTHTCARHTCASACMCVRAYNVCTYVLTHTRARARAHTHTHTHTQPCTKSSSRNSVTKFRTNSTPKLVQPQGRESRSSRASLA